MKINLDKYIRELLLQHDCVILPGLGGFIANYKPAEFDVSQKSVLPPSRQLLFNPNLIHNDGLLYAHVSKETDYGYKEVQAMAEVYFKTIKYEVGKGLKFVFEDLGYLFLNKARKIEFAQETEETCSLPPTVYLVGPTSPHLSASAQASNGLSPLSRSRGTVR